MAKAALKAESNFIAGGSVLKLEVQVGNIPTLAGLILKRLDGRRYVAQLLQAAKKTRYSYMVMTLFGQSLNTLLRRIHECSVSTQVRVGINILYGLKQLHEVGYVHRDIKPANLAVGRRGQETRVIHMLDFGLAREYVIRSEGTVKMRIPRTGTLFRGTTRYCSANAHKRSEQGRPDDLWSMLYVLAEMRGPLPWDRVRGKEEIGKVKEATSDMKLCRNSPKEILDIAIHLRSLNYYTRPDYLLIYNKLAAVMSKCHYRYSDPYDWEKTKYSSHRRHSRRGRRSSASTTSYSSVDSRNEESLTKEELKTAIFADETPPQSYIWDNDKELFTAADFEINEIGF
uniref:Protein kinase domain-containing protein n=1 Tax=Ascaris lumbricoides TaxID=6252 RepID=A0A9J2Q1I6_ASCLU